MHTDESCASSSFGLIEIVISPTLALPTSSLTPHTHTQTHREISASYQVQRFPSLTAESILENKL